jgi:transcriptional regulator with XRE-family HTH domain
VAQGGPVGKGNGCEPAEVRKKLSDIDHHVGARLRERRIILGMNQQQLAKLIGVTYQQLHKYETGQNFLSAGRLWALAGALGVGMNYFFHGVGAERSESSARRQRALLELCRSFSRIQKPEHRAGICELVRILASAAGDPSNGTGERVVLVAHAQHAAGHAGGDAPSGHTRDHHAAGADHRTLADLDPVQEQGAEAD